MLCSIPRSTYIHSVSLEADAQRVPPFPSTAAYPGTLPLSFEDVDAVFPSLNL